MIENNFFKHRRYKLLLYAASWIFLNKKMEKINNDHHSFNENWKKVDVLILFFWIMSVTPASNQASLLMMMLVSCIIRRRKKKNLRSPSLYRYRNRLCKWNMKKKILQKKHHHYQPCCCWWLHNNNKTTGVNIFFNVII